MLVAYILFDTPVGMAAGSYPDTTRTFGHLFTDIGKSGWILFLSAYIALAGWAALRQKRASNPCCQARLITQAAAYVFVCVAASGLIANLLKRMIGRARPELFTSEGIFSFEPFAGQAVFESFPSGHATTAAALFVALALLFPRLRAGLVLAGLWVGLARVIVGAHYPSDVLAGLALGTWFSWMLATQLARRGILFEVGDGMLPVRKRLTALDPTRPA